MLHINIMYHFSYSIRCKKLDITQNLNRKTAKQIGVQKRETEKARDSPDRGRGSEKV